MVSVHMKKCFKINCAKATVNRREPESRILVLNPFQVAKNLEGYQCFSELYNSKKLPFESPY